MNNKNFWENLQKCFQGNLDATYMLIKEYEGVINKYSTINGEIDEDLKSEIIIYLLRKTRNFEKILNKLNFFKKFIKI